ncbi:MAG TPA: signal peptidase II [Candidatus Limnocylindrales bacterium]|nr:signal peptidase II [Candidatus Limnocylindrales bacterium]
MRLPSYDSGMAGVRALLARHRVLLGLLALDAITKRIAFSVLPSNETVSVMGVPVFQLALNEWGVMGGVEGIGSVTSNSAYTLILAAGLLVQALVIWWLGSVELQFWLRLVAGLTVFFAIATAAEFAAKPMADVSADPAVVVTSIRGAALVLSLALYAVSRAPLPRLAFTLLAGGALANALSYAYPPFEVVDFLRIPLPGRDDVYGVVNLADVYVLAFVVVAMAWPLLSLLQWMRQRRVPSVA